MKNKIELKRLGIYFTISLLCFSGLYFAESFFLEKVSTDMHSLFTVSFIYFSISCISSILLLEILSNFVPEKLAIGFLILTMMKLGGFILIYMSRDDIPKTIRLLILGPMFLGVILEVIYLSWRIEGINRQIDSK